MMQELPQAYQPNTILQNATDYHAQLIGTLWRRVLPCLHPAHPRYTFAPESTIRNLFADQTPPLHEAVNLALFCVSARVTIEKFDRLLFHLEHLSGRSSSVSFPLLTYDRLIDCLLAIVETRQHELLWEAFLLLGHAKEARAVEPLLTSLTDSRGWVRMAAAYALGRIGDKRAVEPLLSLLHEERDDLRWIAVGALARLGDERVLGPFLDALTDPCRTVRNYASSALRNTSFLSTPDAVDLLRPFLDGLDDPIIVAPLIPIALTGDEQAVKQAVVSLVEPLLERLKSERKDDRRDVVLVLGKIGDQRAIAPLLAIFAQQDLGIQTVTITALEQIKMSPAVKQQAMASLVEPLLDRLKRDDPRSHLHVMRLLSKIGDQRVVGPLMAIFAQQNLATQTVSIAALEKIEMSPAIKQQVMTSLVEPLLERLKRDDPASHLQIVQLLGKVGDQRVVATLLTMLAQSKADMQVGIIEALEQIGTRLDMLLTIKQQVVDILMQALLARFRSDDETERVEAMQVLAQIGFQRSIFPLIAPFDYEEWFSDGESKSIDTQTMETLLEELIVSLRSEEKAVRLCAVQATGKFGDRRAVVPLTAIFAQQDSATQNEIIDALGALGVLHIPKQPVVAALVEPLLARLSTDDQVDRARIVQMLGKIGDRRAVPTLLAIFAQQDVATQVKIVDALEQLHILRPARKHAVAALAEVLFAHLNSEKRSDRLSTVLMLGKIGDQQAVAPLLAIFAQQDPLIQFHIIDVLERLGMRLDTFPAGKQQAVQALIACLDDEDGIDRYRIVQLFGKIGDQRAVNPLLAIFAQQDSPAQTEDRDDDVPPPTLQAQIITALEQIEMPSKAKQQTLESLIEPLITGLGSDKDRLNSIQLLGRIGDQRAATALIALLDKPLAAIQIETAIITALEQIGMRLDMLQTIKQDIVDTLIGHLRKNDYFSPYHTLEILGEIRDQRIVEPLIAIFAQQRSTVQNEIIDVLKQIGMSPTVEKQTLESLIEVLIAQLNAEDWFNRRDSALMLGKIGDQQAVAPLLAIFAREDTRVQAGIIEALEQIDLPQVASFVPYLLDSQDQYLRVRGVWALVRLYGPEAIPQLSTLRDDPGIGDAVTHALRDLERMSAEVVPAEELSLEERKQREYQRGRVIALDPEAQSINDSLPAFMAPPPDAPAYYGFVVLHDVEAEGFLLGKISDFEAMPDMVAGDAFIIAPDNSRAGLVWEMAEEVFVREISFMEENRWGVWGVGFLYPMTTRDNMRRNLQNLLPFLGEEWKIWQEYYG